MANSSANAMPAALIMASVLSAVQGGGGGGGGGGDASPPLPLASGDGWVFGRATWYDDSPAMSVHTGSCMYGYLGDRFGGVHNWQVGVCSSPLGRSEIMRRPFSPPQVGAMNDGNPLFSGSCGKCFEIQCVPMSFKDGYGSMIDRTKDCQSQQPIVITITDSCPCVKPDNAYSNRRWCCGDMGHFDLGVWAFKEMADPGKGVVGIKYRPITCPQGRAGPISSMAGG